MLLIFFVGFDTLVSNDDGLSLHGASSDCVCGIGARDRLNE